MERRAWGALVLLGPMTRLVELYLITSGLELLEDFAIPPAIHRHACQVREFWDEARRRALSAHTREPSSPGGLAPGESRDPRIHAAKSTWTQQCAQPASYGCGTRDTPSTHARSLCLYVHGDTRATSTTAHYYPSHLGPRCRMPIRKYAVSSRSSTGSVVKTFVMLASLNGTAVLSSSRWQPEGPRMLRNLDL